MPEVIRGAKGARSCCSPRCCAAYVIASSITGVFNCSIDTIFVCAFKDIEENSPPKFLSTSLRDGFGLKDVEPVKDPKLVTGSNQVRHRGGGGA